MVDQVAGARTDVTMPQMGETVTEGTVVRWLKAAGDQVVADEPLLEISTDKVDAEIPSPADGTLVEVLVEEGATVPIGTLIARLATGAADGPGPAAERDRPEAGPEPDPSMAPPSEADGSPRPPRSGGNGFLSPVVRRLVAEHDLDLDAVEGSGAGGRITRDDALAAVAGHEQGSLIRASTTDEATAPVWELGPGVERVPFTPIRRTIGRRMVASQHEAAHTLVVTEVDYARVEPVKEAAGLTWLPFVARATIDALAQHPYLNAHVDDDGLDVHHAVHLGIAVDLGYEGLVVPVVRDADRLRLRPLAEAAAHLATAARDRTLGPDDLNGGTFTITNAGRYGTLLTAPIINRPQAAILATDAVKVRPVAVPLPGGEHGLAFHPVGNLCLSFDHRAVDGAYASAFLGRVRDLLQDRSWADEVGGARLGAGEREQR
jgi:2-oxoglutarate dehydrogenase E2 component (dihydrolipoamide succinyltransferase)